jgi:hypothetical protein
MLCKVILFRIAKSHDQLLHSLSYYFVVQNRGLSEGYTIYKQFLLHYETVVPTISKLYRDGMLHEILFYVGNFDNKKALTLSMAAFGCRTT